MKKKLSNWLFMLAKRLNPSVVLDNTAEARPMGLCVHISKKDVRQLRKEHPEVKSHRDGLRLLIGEAKWRIAGAIGRGLMEKNDIFFNVSKTPYVADVTGIAYVYDSRNEEEGKQQAE